MSKLRIKEAQAHMQKKLEQTSKQVGVFLEAESKARTPVDTGHLRRSISHDTEVSDTKAVVGVGSNVEYDPHVELNHQPHHKPAITENISTIQSMVHKGMKL